MVVPNLVQVTGLTPLEAIMKGNAERKRIAPNSTANRLLLGTKEWTKYSWSNYFGTGFAMEAKGKPFGDKIEKEFHDSAAGKNQTLIYYVRKGDIGAKDIMHLFEHQFQGDESTIQLINAKTQKQILTVESLHEADEIILKVTGEIRNFNLTNRDGEVFETVERGDTFIHASDKAAVGLIRRDYLLGHWRIVGADDYLVDRRGVLYEGAAKAETGMQAPAAEKEAPSQITIASPQELKSQLDGAKAELAQIGDGILMQTKKLIVTVASLLQ